MNRCIRVCEADKITHHMHSILIAFKNNQQQRIINNVSEDGMPLQEQQNPTINTHPVVCYVKADSTEEIRWLVLFLGIFRFKIF